MRVINRCYSVMFICFMMSSCISSSDVYKIIIIAPFEGTYREIGYNILPAVRLAIQDCEHGANDSFHPQVNIEAYDLPDDANGVAEILGRINRDRDVIGVIGLWPESFSGNLVESIQTLEVPVATYTIGTFGETYNLSLQEEHYIETIRSMTEATESFGWNYSGDSSLLYENDIAAYYDYHAMFSSSSITDTVVPYALVSRPTGDKGLFQGFSDRFVEITKGLEPGYFSQGGYLMAAVILQQVSYNWKGSYDCPAVDSLYFYETGRIQNAEILVIDIVDGQFASESTGE